MLSCLFDGELLFVNTRLLVKVKLSVFNLIKAIQSCRKEVKIWRYTMMWMLRATWLVVAHDLLEYRHTDDVKGILFSLPFSSTWDYFEFSRCNPPNSFSRNYLQRGKMENRRQKEFLTTLECLKTTRNLHNNCHRVSCIAMRDWQICQTFSRLFCFERVKALRTNVAKDWAKLEIVKQNLPSYFVCS